MTKEKMEYLQCYYNSAASFGEKAFTQGNKLYSYLTLVAEIVDGKPIVYNMESNTTIKHIREWLLQNNFKAGTSAQIEKQYGEFDYE